MVSDSNGSRTIPPPTAGIDDDTFWRYLSERELRLQRCRRCQEWRYPPGPICPNCLASDTEWRRITGDGRLLAWATFHRRYFPYLATPYLVAAVKIQEGPLVCGSLRVPEGTHPRLDAPVTLEAVEAQLPDGQPWAIFDWVMNKPETEGDGDRHGGDNA